MVGPLATVAEPHSWDLCESHSQRITVPLGWEMVRVEQVTLREEDADDAEDDDLTALALAVREAGRVTTGLVDDNRDPIEFAPYQEDPSDPATSNHPVLRTRRVDNEKAERRAHLSIVPDPED